MSDLSNALTQDQNRKIDLAYLCEEFKKHQKFAPEIYNTMHVKRGLRNSDGTGVVAGLTNISNVHGYVMDEGEKSPIDGKLVYRGINVNDLVQGCINEQRYGFEETVWLLLFGSLPTKTQLESFCELLAQYRDLPDNFTEDMIFKMPSKNIMNELARCVLALYTYEENPDDNALENVMRQSISLIARIPTIMVSAFQVKSRVFDKQSMFFHPIDPKHSVAQSILATLRPDRQFTEEEAHLLDLCLMLHAEHGGGNNSTFACRVISSSGSDTYSAIAAAIGSLKGPRHGGANIKVCEMVDAMHELVEDPYDDEQVKTFLRQVLDKQAGDRSGLIYGIGHAVYTKSDPRAVLLKKYAYDLAQKRSLEKEFAFFEAIERLAPSVFAEKKGDSKFLCANVDLYSGFVYQMLSIPRDLYTPLFAVSRMAGWCAHRIEEITTCNRIIRPAYKIVLKDRPYAPLSER